MAAVRRLLVCLLALGPVALLGAAPATAHGDEGVLEVIDTVPNAAGDEVTYTVELTYENDGDPVDAGSVSATARQAGAGPQEPIAFASIGEGWYAGTVVFPGPGRWTVAFDAVEPVAAIEVTHQVSATPPPTTTAAPTTTTAPDVGPTLEPAEEDIDEGPPAGLIVGAVLAGAFLVAIVIILILRRRSLD